jgi:hypothetical protein
MSHSSNSNSSDNDYDAHGEDHVGREIGSGSGATTSSKLSQSDTQSNFCPLKAFMECAKVTFDPKKLHLLCATKAPSPLGKRKPGK